VVRPAPQRSATVTQTQCALQLEGITAAMGSNHGALLHSYNVAWNAQMHHKDFHPSIHVTVYTTHRKMMRCLVA